jgi:hypothetical protein
VPKTFQLFLLLIAAALSAGGCWRSAAINGIGDDAGQDTASGITDPDTSPTAGYAWSFAAAPTDAALSGVFGFSSADVFAVGEGDTILRYDGAAWNAMAYPVGAPGSDLGAVWGTAPDDVYAVGTGGVILRFDGEAWAGVSSPTSENLRDVCGRGPGDAFAVGDNGTLLALDGASWSAIATGVSQNLVAVWCAAGTEAYAGGHLDDAYGSTAVLRYDGATIEAIDHPVGHFMYALAGDAPETVYLGGGYQGEDEAPHFGVYRAAGGGSFELVAEGAALLVDMLSLGGGELWAVGRMSGGTGAEAGAVYHLTGSALGEPAVFDGTGTLRAVWRDPLDAGGTVFAVGDGGAILMGTPSVQP